MLGVSAAATAGAVFWRRESEPTPLVGSAAGPALDVLRDAEITRLLLARGVVLAAPTEAGLADPEPIGDYSLRIGDSAARASRSDRVFTSPLVVYARPAVAAAWRTRELVVTDAGRTLVDAAGLFNAATRVAPPPVRSDAALLLAALAGATGGAVSTAPPMTLDAFLAAEPEAAPALAGFESALAGWIAADPKRWAQFQASRPNAVPVTLTLRPTIVAAWTLHAMTPAAAPLADALLSPEVQARIRLRHGLRGPEGQSGAGETFTAASRLPPSPTALVPPPDAATLRALAAP